ncbi:pimeloyl-ACP methyl ester carboxylesterase [Amycolatopsis bartoniae]|uniref:Alpha/beta hydrolase n=1 Tax=Amycolatopsis bartoniae TaxID=941986 RepID=A0A8H9J0J9_9PSEU|nr:alpha/beta hydrolase [Amycolatopsis bartoniae]MBB2937424.1 pimeloyl-ACP methyl ester carboxylesterase [Amycolatopsis bartoniae]GHF86684.1 alpha/beta hydrolase [Amycolatopsis bartoniae]
MKPRAIRRALSAVLLVTLAVSTTACAENTSASPDPTLHVVENNGHRLAFHFTPGSSPAIVLDAGGGSDSSYWKDLVPRLHAATGDQIITYDRAGLGDSDEVPGPWRVEDAVSDLEAGLRTLGVTENVVLVSHSQAGEIATYFVRRNPRLVSGAVLVDASLPPLYTDDEITRLVAANQPQVDAARKDPSSKQNRQLLATADSFVAVHRAYHQVAWPDAVPATVIVSEKTPFDGSPEDAQRWREAAASFARAAPNRTLVTAAGSSHDIPVDRPDLVLDWIEKMASLVR